MPVYSYRCRDCGETFDLLVGVVADEEKPKCAVCKSTNLEKLLSTFGVGRSGEGSGDCTAST
jgi:putative FmdB family regulatory protein